MRRLWICFLAAMLCFASCAWAESVGVQVIGENAGEVYMPEGSDAQSARYVYRYSYPQVENTSETAQMINDFYTYLVDDAKNFAVPGLYGDHVTGDVQYGGVFQCAGDDGELYGC